MPPHNQRPSATVRPARSLPRTELQCRKVAAVLAAALLACVSGAVSAQGSGARLPVTRLTAGIHVISAEVATNPGSRAQGLMFREQLAPNHGMLFIFEERAIQCMWMRNTFIPLSVAFVADNGTIINIEDMQPRDESSHCARQPVRFALEMTKGWFAQRGLRPGSKLGGLPALERAAPTPK